MKCKDRMLNCKKGKQGHKCREEFRDSIIFLLIYISYTSVPYSYILVIYREAWFHDAMRRGFIQTSPKPDRNMLKVIGNRNKLVPANWGDVFVIHKDCLLYPYTRNLPSRQANSRAGALCSKPHTLSRAADLAFLLPVVVLLRPC